ncbi:DUF4397 domain-containing protein [Halosimplex pelagicum]|uniref:DUF4397 domain-containing protein n=1 Tax=Halosimplex pelagicum TaxID=869886 RepID=A0A7D5PGV1_9EURY|nr:DUF4397 domain-containing protein [Halosimplex pelagicum]QLH84419.1 DUF4397 domain-containing protein [Halosimplex pelagicum]
MTYDRYTKAIVGAVALTLVVSALAAGGAASSFTAQEDEDTTTQTQDTSYLRIGHFSPDAPAVDVSVDNETVVEGAEFGDVTGYLALESGNHTATISVADQPTNVLFEGNLTLEPRTVGTLAASGEFSSDSEAEFEPVLFEDNAWEPDNESAAVSLVHLSPDAPAVDVVVTEGPTEETETETGTETATETETETETGTETATDSGTATETATAQGSPTATPTSTVAGATDTATEAGATATPTDTVGVDNLMPAQQEENETYLAQNLSFQNATDYMNVPAGDYTVEIRDNETGDVLATVDLSVEGGTAYSVFAAGYAAPEDAPAGASFTVIPVEDATMTVSLPEMATEDDTATDMGTETATDTETETETETATDDGTATETDTGTDTATDTGAGTATDTGTDTATDTGTDTATDTGAGTATDTGAGTATDTATEAGA